MCFAFGIRISITIRTVTFQNACNIIRELMACAVFSQHMFFTVKLFCSASLNLASASASYIRPRPRGSGFGLSLGLTNLASRNITAENLVPCCTANPVKKLHPPPREIYSGGGLLVGSINVPHLFEATCISVSLF